MVLNNTQMAWVNNFKNIWECLVSGSKYFETDCAYIKRNFMLLVIQCYSSRL